MPVFVCDECGCVENTGLGFYWGAKMNRNWFDDPSKNGKVLCSECCPEKFSDGTSTEKGKWHNKFPKVQWDGKREMLNRGDRRGHTKN